MLTVTLLLLYRKLIPLRFLPWCDNLIILGCRRTVVFLCFAKVKKRASCICISSSKLAAPGPNWLKFGEHVVRTFADKTVSANSDYSSHKNVIPFFHGSYAFFSQAVLFFFFQTLSYCKKITDACAKNLRNGF